ncbi:MAG TPA: hypothetical protein VFQ65_03470 [Kofleriaceae bacterium]|nr:hypothetical protein [Kofleriaceae bacterium]
MRLILIAALVAGCATNDDGGEGAHLVAHVTSPSDFDQVFVSYDGNLQTTIPLPQPGKTYDWDHWEVFNPLDEVSITVALGGNAVATGEASNITYVAQDDGTLLAKILLPLGP